MNNNLDNIDDIDEFPETHKLPNLTQEEIENLNSPIASKETGNFLTQEMLGPDGFTGEFYQTFKEELTPILLRLF